MTRYRFLGLGYNSGRSQVAYSTVSLLFHSCNWSCFRCGLQNQNHRSSISYPIQPKYWQAWYHDAQCSETINKPTPPKYPHKSCTVTVPLPGIAPLSACFLEIGSTAMRLYRSFCGSLWNRKLLLCLGSGVALLLGIIYMLSITVRDFDLRSFLLLFYFIVYWWPL